MSIIQNKTEANAFLGNDQIDFINSPQIMEENNNKVSMKTDIKHIKQYDETNLEEGKIRFRIRYIKSKLAEKEHTSRFHSKSVYRPMGNKPKINCDTSLVKTEPVTQDVKVIDEEKEIRKYNSLFLKKAEKSIFSFNLKKYEDSYNVLLVNGIIKNIAEFGEFLLVVDGFDKYIMGEFLSKQKPPNDNDEVLLSFINCMNFKDKPFLSSLRFLLSRLNLPKDANLILNIIDKFSTRFFEANKEGKLYKDANAIYLLASSVLALNTMFTRKDIKNMVIMKKEEFVSMNTDVDPKTSEQIYIELQKQPIDMKHNYNELMYRRLTQIVSEKQNSSSINNDEPEAVDRKERISFVIPSNFSSFTATDKELLLNGEMFVKYRISGSPHNRFVYLTKDLKRLIWERNKTYNNNSSHFIDVNDIIDIYLGTSNSQVFRNNNIPFELDSTCFTIQTVHRTIDLSNEHQEIVFKWFKALKALITQLKSQKDYYKKKNQKEKVIQTKDALKCIWKDEILPNWICYRSYFRELNSDESKKTEGLTLSIILDKIEERRDSHGTDKYLTIGEFAYVLYFGIPKWARQKIWFILLRNICGINENLFDFYLTKIEKVNFYEADKRYHLDVNTSICPDYTLNKMIIDIIKVKDYYIDQIVSEKMDEIVVMRDLFKIVRIFKIYRPDILYNKYISYMSMLFLLNQEDYYNSFINLVNLIFPRFILKFLLRDEETIQNYIAFFDQLKHTYLPNIEAHFKKLEISTALYFEKWFESLFVKVFKYKMVLRIWDRFILKGECVLFQVALALISIQQNELVTLPISEVFQRLKRLPQKYSDSDFFKKMEEFKIEQEFIRWKNENQIAKEKGLLFQLYMDDLV